MHRTPMAPSNRNLRPQGHPKGSEGSSIKSEKKQGELVMGQNFSICLFRKNFEIFLLEMS